MSLYGPDEAASEGRLTFDSFPDELICLVFDHVKEASLEIRHPLRSLFIRRLFESEYKVPKELMNLRLVSRRISRLATPYMWERHQIFIGPDRDAKDQYGLTLTDSINQMNRLCLHPNLMAHVKTLSLHFGPHFYTEAARKLLRQTIERLIDLAPILRAFYLNKPYMLSPSAARSLLSRRSLQVLDIYDWPPAEDFNEKHLSQLETSDVQVLGLSRLDGLCNGDFVSKFKNLKSVYLRQFPGYSGMLGDEEKPIDLPWIYTVEELNINNSYAPTMRQIGQAYEIASTHASIPLREFAFNASFATTRVEPDVNGPTLEDVFFYLRAARLEKLILYHTHNLSTSQLDNIFSTFPNLRHLTLYSDMFAAHTYSTECASFEDYAKVFEKARNLQVLEWDNVRSVPMNQGDQYANERSMSLHDLGYDAGLPILARHAPVLHLVRSSSFFLGVVDNYEIVRDAKGAYESYNLHTTKGICLTTTSWDVPSTQFL